MPPTTARETLLRALRLIEIGWTRGRDKKMRGSRASYCLTGAIWAAGAPPKVRWISLRAVGYILSPVHPRSDRQIVRWNDMPRRTKPQVIAVLKRAIQLAGGYRGNHSQP